MKKLLFLILYTIIILLIGRNLLLLPKISFSSPEDQTATIKQDIQQYLKNKKGVYSVYYKNLNDGSSFGINEQQIYTAGSLNKVPIVATLYVLAKEGKINLDDQIILQKDDIQDYGTGSLRYQKPGGAYSLKTLAKFALQQSDNTAAKLIAVRIGTDVIQNQIGKWGLTQTHMLNNKTSAKDMGIIFEKIYTGDAASPASTPELLGFLSHTDFEDRIPLFLPKNVTVYHKIGEVIGGIHDVGIVKIDDNHQFFLAVLTSDIGDNELETKKTIGEIAKKIFDYNRNNQ